MRQEYDIIETLSTEYDVVLLCELAGVSRSGYYKWRGRSKEAPHDRQEILDLVKEIHESHPSHGYRWVHAYLVRNKKITVSADYIRKAFKFLGIESKTKHKVHRNPRKVKDPYPNLIFSTWETVDRPRQVIASDMTAFWTLLRYWELTLYFDVYTKQILGRGISPNRGYSGTYYDGLDEALDKLESTEEEPTIIHTDQGSVYTSFEYNKIIKEHNIVRSLSRAGKPTDNPVNESLNGWIKEELFMDFGLYNAEDVVGTIDAYIEFYNSERPSYSLGYDTPDNFYARFM
ncbi:MAG: IS3 family transposase, partial [Clostridiales Family XIII bacterium]|nr:IS3 family transposase [Clostridiales Family XIII bacterium]